MNKHRFILFLCLLFIITTIFTGCTNNNITKIREDINPTYTTEQVESALEFALTREGYPYVWGGNGPDEFDCSGLIVWSYKQVDRNIEFKIGNMFFPDASIDDIYNFNIVKIPPSQLKPGDLIFLTHETDRITHGGLFVNWVDNSTFRYIHASSADSNEKVVIATRDINYIGYQWFAGAGRLINYK